MKTQIINLINSHPERAKNALENVHHGKVFVVVTAYGRIDGFFKTRRGAEGYIKKQSRLSWYDDYSQSMVNAGSGLEVVEIAAYEIKDYRTDKKMWWNWFHEWLSHPHWADNIVQSAKHFGVSAELLAWIEETAKEVKETHGLTHLEDEEEQQEETETIEATEEQKEQQITEQTTHNNVMVTLNEQFQGVEIRFSEKPSHVIIDSLKAHGFRWSKRGFWYAKQSEKTLAFANSLTGETANNSTTKTDQTTEAEQPTQQEQQTIYPEIDIDDLDKYTVSDELQRRLHSSEMFPIDYKKDCFNTFQNIQNEAIKVLSLTDDPKLTYYIKKYLQSFKKRYYEQYLKILNHRASNPSWVVTGRGGLNVRRYNKMQDRYDKLLGESVRLSEEFKKKMQDFKWQIQRDKEQKIKRFIEQELSRTDNSLTFSTEKREVTLNGYTEKVRAYIHGDYLICRTWGTFRIFKNGKHIHAMKTTERLDDAKKYVAFLIAQDKQKLVTA